MMSSASDAMAAERVQSQELLKELSQVPGDHLSPDPGLFNLLPQEKMPLDEEGNDLPTDQLKISVLQEAANLFRSSQGIRPTRIRAMIRRSVEERGGKVFMVGDIRSAGEELGIYKNSISPTSTRAANSRHGPDALVAPDSFVISGLEKQFPQAIETYIPEHLRPTDEYGFAKNMITEHTEAFLEALLGLLLEYEAFAPEKYHQTFKDVVQQRLNNTEATEKNTKLTVGDIWRTYDCWENHNPPKQNNTASSSNGNDTATFSSAPASASQPTQTTVPRQQTPKAESTAASQVANAGPSSITGTRLHCAGENKTYRNPAAAYGVPMITASQAAKTQEVQMGEPQRSTQVDASTVPEPKAASPDHEGSVAAAFDFEMSDLSYPAHATASDGGDRNESSPVEPDSAVLKAASSEGAESMNGITHTGPAFVAPEAAQAQADEPRPMLVDSIRDSDRYSTSSLSGSSRGESVAACNDDSSKRPQAGPDPSDRAETAEDIQILDAPADENGYESSQPAATASVEPDNPIAPKPSKQTTPEGALQDAANGPETERHDSPIDDGASAEKLQAEQTDTSVDKAYSSADAEVAMEKDLNAHTAYEILADDELYVGDLYEDDVDEINGGNELTVIEPVSHFPARYAFNHLAQTLAAEALMDNAYRSNGASRRKRFVLYCLPCRRNPVHGATIKIRLNMAFYHDLRGERNKRSGPLSSVRRSDSRTTISLQRPSPINQLWKEQSTSFVELLPYCGIQKQKRNTPRLKHLDFKCSGNGRLKLKRRSFVSSGSPKAAIGIPTKTPTEAVTQNGIKSMVEAYVDVLYYTRDEQRIQEANGLIAKYSLDRPFRAEKGHGFTYRHRDGSITGIPMNPAAQYNIFELERNLDTQRVIKGYDDILTPTNDRIDWSIMFLWRLVERAAKELERAVQAHMDWKHDKYGPTSTAPICSFELAYENAPHQPRTCYRIFACGASSKYRLDGVYHDSKLEAAMEEVRLLVNSYERALSRGQKKQWAHMPTYESLEIVYKWEGDQGRFVVAASVLRF